jgi:hypothetical protein
MRVNRFGNLHHLERGQELGRDEIGQSIELRANCARTARWSSPVGVVS